MECTSLVRQNGGSKYESKEDDVGRNYGSSSGRIGVYPELQLKYPDLKAFVDELIGTYPDVFLRKSEP